MSDISNAYQQLYAYSMGRDGFILQRVVDAEHAQTLDASSRPIGAVFSLAGLYLHVEKGFHGRQVQQVHQVLARRKRTWPTILLPDTRGEMTADDVMAAPAGPERDRAIHEWCKSVWNAYRVNEAIISSLLREYDLI